MKLAEGVDLHLIKQDHFRTNHLTFRFSTERQLKTIARRSLVAQMLATANQSYPTTRDFREQLANLYGASFSTSISTRGLMHIVDIDITFINNKLALQDEDILEEILTLLSAVLFQPLISLEKYQSQTFQLEQKNLIRYMEADNEDPFYTSNLGLQELYYDNEEMQLSKYGTIDLVAKENAFTAYQEFQRMLREDKIDIFIVGQFNDYQAIRYFTQLPLPDRTVQLPKYYKQDFSNIIREKVVAKQNNQSILQLGYHLPVYYGDKNYYALLVADGILGSFSHSKLFTVIREQESLAYSIGSRFDCFSGFFKIYAGIDKTSRNKVLKLINTQLNHLKSGRFSSQLIKQTKQMLISNAKASLDNPKALIEQEYSRSIYQTELQSLETFVENIVNVSKQDIISVISLIKLQAIYFLEGE